MNSKLRFAVILTEELNQTMLDAAKPLIKWMSDNCHPHCTAIVTACSVELTEGIAMCKRVEFLYD